MFVSAIRKMFSRDRVNSEGDATGKEAAAGQMQKEEDEAPPGRLKRAEEYEESSECSTVLSSEEGGGADSRVTIFYPDSGSEIPPGGRIPELQAHIYGEHEHPPDIYGVVSSEDEVSSVSSFSPRSELGDSAESAVSEYLPEEDDEKENHYAQGDVSSLFDDILEDDRPLYSEDESVLDELALARQSRSHASLAPANIDHFGYEFEQLSQADFDSLLRRSRSSKSLRSVGIDYTPSGPQHQYKRDSYAPSPSSQQHGHRHSSQLQQPPPSDAHSLRSHQSGGGGGGRPVPIDGVIAANGYRNRVHMRDSASASPHSFLNRRSLQQLNNSGAYVNLGGSFNEFPLSASGGTERETRRPPIPQRASLVSESTVSTASPVVMRHQQQQQQYSSTPLSARRGLELNGYGGGGGREPARYSAAGPTYYDEIQQQQQLQMQQQSRHHPSSQRKAHRVSSSGGIAVTSASGQRGMVTSHSHHDGYPNGGYTMEEYGVEEHSGGSSGGASSSFERDQYVITLENRLRAVEEQMKQQQPAAAAAAPAAATPTFARSARHHPVQQLQQSQQQRVPPTPLEAAALAEKDAEIGRLQKRLEAQQVQYEEEIRTIRRDTEGVSGEHSVFKNKLARMERELEEYKERAAGADSAAVAAAASEKIERKESELSAVRVELDRLKKDKELMEKRQEQIEFLQMQNETLNERLDEREGDVKTLQDQLVTLRLEQSLYQQSCSSGSTPLADEETRSEVTRTPQNANGHSHHHGDSASVGGGGQLARVRQYTKAHSTLGASGIAITTPTSSSASPSLAGTTPKTSGGLAKSLSNYHLDAAGVGRSELPPALSVMLRKTQKLSVDSRALAHCIRECAEKTMRGEEPDTNLLVGRMTGESMSDSSDCEVVATDCTKMSLETAEKTLRQQEVTLGKLHSSLESMRGLLLQVYQRRFHDEMERGDEACRVQ